jgi:hypothetical protein
VKYEIVDNFLTLEDLAYLQSLLETLEPKSDSQTSFRNVRNSIPNKNTISNEKFKQLEEAYLPRAVEILRRLAPHKLDLVDDVVFNLQATPPNFSFPVHLDDRKKVLSGVIYLKPNLCTGTILHKGLDDDSGEEIPWVVNRAFFFSRTPTDSWHSYKGDGVGYRWVLIFNLITYQERTHEIRDLGIVGFVRSGITNSFLQRKHLIGELGIFRYLGSAIINIFLHRKKKSK